jgi:hypothetical protein
MRFPRAFAMLATLALAACSRGAPDVGDFTRACTASTNLAEALCRCTAEKAKDELSADGFAFLVATLEGDENEVAALRPKLAVTEATAAGMFMVSGPARCARDAVID